MMTLDEAVARKVLETVDAGLVQGMGEQVPGAMCVEAAVCFALGLPHSDDPPCVGEAVRAYKIRLNDAFWSSDAARAKGMRRVAIAQLGSNEIDQRAFADYVVIQCVRRVLPIALRATASRQNAANSAAILATVPACEAAVTLSDARLASSLSRKACRAAAAAAAAYAADAAAAAAAAADAAYADAYAAAAAAADAAAAAYAAAADAADAAADAADADADADAVADAYADAAAYAADAAAYAAYADAAAYAAAAAAADAAARDKILSLAAEIAVEALQAQSCKGCEWLHLCEVAQ